MKAVLIAFHFVAIGTGFVPSLNPNNLPPRWSSQRSFERNDNNNVDASRDIKTEIVNRENLSWLEALKRTDKVETQGRNVGDDDDDDGTDETIFDSFPFSFGSERKQSKLWESDMRSLFASLSGIINVEALMVAAKVETQDDIKSDLPDRNRMEETKELMSEDGAQMGQRIVFSSDNATVHAPDKIGSQISATNALSFLDGTHRWERFVSLMQNNSRGSDSKDEYVGDNKNNLAIVPIIEGEGEIVSPNSANILLTKTVDADKLLRDATRSFEIAMNSASSTFSPSAIQDLVLRATKILALQEGSDLTAAAKNVFDAASTAPRATAKYTAELIEFANAVLAGGFVGNNDESRISANRRTLFSNYPSAKVVPVSEHRQTVQKAAEFSTLCGATYENTFAATHSLGHSVVATGKTSNICWMITDSVQCCGDFSCEAETDHVLVRSFILRGFDASDGDVNRECLLNELCMAAPIPVMKSERSTVQAHGGMMEIAKQLYYDLLPFMDVTSPLHRFVFAGHSIGGSLSTMLLAILSVENPDGFVRDRVLRVFTFGSPPIFSLERDPTSKQITTDSGGHEDEKCCIMEALNMPSDIVYGYSQPWDPIVRLFTQYDPLYPLIDDIGEDGATLYVSGPPRTLRPITKAIFESWEGWPRFRDNARLQSRQNYLSAGRQFLFLPDPTRYLSDRIVSVNTAVPPIDRILEISPRELLPALNEVFPLDTFSISIIPVAIRSFIHHFYPAYGYPLVDFATKYDSKTITIKDAAR